MDLAGKNVVYLGGFGGIGQKTCPELLKRQLQALAVFDLKPNAEVLAAWQAQYPKTTIFYQQMDATKKSDVEAAYKAAAKKMGQFDVVINGMGLMDDRYVDLTIQINLMGVIYSSLCAFDYMDKTKSGRGGVVLNISSVVGIEPAPSFSIYSAAKHGVTAFTRSMAGPDYYQRTGIAFITVCPGFTETPLLDDMAAKTTFDFDMPMKHLIPVVKRQSPEICAEYMVKLIEMAKNGSVWLIDVGDLKEMQFPKMWTPQFHNK